MKAPTHNTTRMVTTCYNIACLRKTNN